MRLPGQVKVLLTFGRVSANEGPVELYQIIRLGGTGKGSFLEEKRMGVIGPRPEGTVS